MSFGTRLYVSVGLLCASACSSVREVDLREKAVRESYESTVDPDSLDQRLARASMQDPLALNPAEANRWDWIPREADGAEGKVFSPRGAVALEVRRGEGARSEIVRTDLVTGAKKTLTNGEGDAEPTFSPNGEWIVFASRRDGSDELYAMTVNGDRVTRLTRHKGEKSHPSVSPGGGRLAWVQSWDGGAPDEIYVADLELSKANVRITGPRLFARLENARFAKPVWHPDSERVIVSAERDGRASLYALGTSGVDRACVMRLTKNSDDDVAPAFSGDGRYVTWKRGRQLVVATFSLTDAPCDGSRLGVQWNELKMNGVDGR